MRAYNVLSLFGGIETGYAAMRDAGAPIANYWSSEIDKHAIKVSAYNYPEIVHLGDVCSVSVANIPFVPDLLIAGFPCTDLSFAGKQAGLDGTRSGLFFEAVRILRECQAVNPNVLFLFENVPMAKRFERVINEMIGLRPWANNSALVSAQNRKRLWWSNIRTKQVGLFGEVHTDFPQPKDMGIMLADILEKEVNEKYFLSANRLETMKRRIGKHTQIDAEKSMCFTTRTDAGWSGEMITVKYDINGQPKANQDKADCFTSGANSGGNHSDMDLIWQTAWGNNPGGERAQNGKTPCVGANAWQNNNHIFCLNQKRTEYGKAVRKDYEAGKIDGAKRSDMAVPQPREDGKTGTITTVEKDNMLQVGPTLRRLTPVEVCRLFTLPDDLFQTPAGPLVAESHQYRLLGNGWVMKVVSHIFSFLPELQ